jgi:hypothetical protein
MKRVITAQHGRDNMETTTREEIEAEMAALDATHQGLCAALKTTKDATEVLRSIRAIEQLYAEYARMLPAAPWAE